MKHRVTIAAGQAYLCLLGISLWMAVSTHEAHAAQLAGADASAPTAHQEPETPELEDSGINWSSGWSYGGRGIVSMLGEENLDSGGLYCVFGTSTYR